MLFEGRGILKLETLHNKKLKRACRTVIDKYRSWGLRFVAILSMKGPVLKLYLRAELSTNIRSLPNVIQKKRPLEYEANFLSRFNYRRRYTLETSFQSRCFHRKMVKLSILISSIYNVLLMWYDHNSENLISKKLKTFCWY